MTSPILQEEEDKPMAPVKLRIKMGRGRKGSLKEINDSEAASLAAVRDDAKLLILDLTWHEQEAWGRLELCPECGSPVHPLGTQGSHL